jgi:hypothetical protein
MTVLTEENPARTTGSTELEGRTSGAETDLIQSNDTLEHGGGIIGNRVIGIHRTRNEVKAE